MASPASQSTPSRSRHWLGVLLGIDEANIQGEFTGRTYLVECVDDAETVSTHPPGNPHPDPLPAHPSRPPGRGRHPPPKGTPALPEAQPAAVLAATDSAGLMRLCPQSGCRSSTPSS